MTPIGWVLSVHIMYISVYLVTLIQALQFQYILGNILYDYVQISVKLISS